MAKLSEKDEALTNALTDYMHIVIGGIDKFIKLTNLVTNWAKISGKPTVFPVDGTADASIAGLWTYLQSLKMTVLSKINPGANVGIEMEKGNLLYIEPDTNFTLEATSVFEGDCMVIIKQPGGGGPHTMVLQAGSFGYVGATPVLSTAADAVDVLVLRHNATLGKTIVIDFLQGLTFN